MKQENLMGYPEELHSHNIKINKSQETKEVTTSEIADLAKNYNVNIVSGIRTYGNLGPFRPLDIDNFKGIRLFDILLRPNQIASCSTIMQGDTYKNLYSRWGVIIGDGQIHESFPYDAVTSVIEGKVNSKFLPRVQNIEPDERMAYTIFARKLHNEVNVGKPKISGVFYCSDEGEIDYRDFPSDSVIDLISPLNMPHYLLRNGAFYKINSLRAIKENNYGKKITPTDIVQKVCEPTVDQKEDMIQYLTENLTLAPRNPITSGVTRGQFAYAYRRLHSLNYDSFYDEQLKLITDRNPSLKLYSAMASFAYGEAAGNNLDNHTREIFYLLGKKIISYSEYKSYKSRILETGNLAITQDDFLYYLETEKLPPRLQDH